MRRAGRPERRRLPEFEAALRKAHLDPEAPQPLCLERGEWWDYTSSPEPEIARKICAPCPLLDPCRTSALHEKPAWGVQGGIAWEYGRQAHLKRTRRLADTGDGLSEDELASDEAIWSEVLDVA